MLQIPEIGTARLHYEELFGHLTKVVACGRATLTQDMDKPILSELEGPVDQFDAVLELSRKNSFTEQQKAADEDFDAAYIHAFEYARVMPFFPVAAAAEAGEEILAIFEKYGNITRLSYIKEYAKALNLIQDLSALPAEALTAANFNPWLEQLTTSHAVFTSLRESKQSEDTATITGAAKEARFAAEDAYHTFVKKINALCVVMGEEHYATFIKQVTTYVEELQVILKSRTTRYAKAKEEEATEGEGGEAAEDQTAGQ